MSTTPTSEPTPDDAGGSISWIAPSEAQRAQQMADTVPQLVGVKLELRWISNAEAGEHATKHLGLTSSKRTLATLRPAQTKALEKVVQKTSKPLSELRLLIKKKFKDAFKAYYPQFGLKLSGEDWRLPYDFDDLEIALREQLLPALTTFGFQDDPDAGTAVWEPIQQELKTALTTARGIDAERSTQVGTTTPLDKKTTDFLRAVVHLVRAHFPETWESILRGWGWNKTSF